MVMPLSTIDIVYHAIQEANAAPYPCSSRTEEVDLVLDPIWVAHSYSSHEYLDDTLP
jgi:hypothetical protein